MRPTFKIGRIAGVPVGVHWTLLIVGFLLSSMLAQVALPESFPGRSSGAYWAAGLIGAGLFFASVLAHETSHALVARRRGVGVHGITLWLLGGVAELERQPSTPSDELRISIAGPAASLGVAALFGVLAVSFDVVGADLLSSVIGWLAAVNLVLALFNLLPAAPLDGGRILHAVLWARHGDRWRATRTAGKAGELAGWALIGLGVVAVLQGVAGLWTVVLGWFILSNARAEGMAAVSEQALQGLSVRDVMSPAPDRVPDYWSVAELVERPPAGRGDLVAVEGFSGDLRGLVPLRPLVRIPASQRSEVRLVELAIPFHQFHPATPDEDLLAVLTRIGASAQPVTVWEDGRLVGLIAAEDVRRAVARRVGSTPPTARPQAALGS